VSCRIDAGRRRICVSVGELCTQGGRSIGLGGRGLSRLRMGQELHRKIQTELEEAEEGFVAELPLAGEFESGGWTLEISGRADGVCFDRGLPLRVDEIKTLHFAVDLSGLYADERLEPFRKQAAIYAWMLARRHGTAPEARLILVDIVSGEQRVKPCSWKMETVEADLAKFLHGVLSAEARREAGREQLRSAAEALPFPHPEQREIQRKIGEEVRLALDAEQTLLLEAPTGSGKTAAVLHPAIQWAFARGKRVFFLTAKTLQQKLAVETVGRMQEGSSFRSLQLRAKAKMCANREMICHEEYCPWAREYGLKMARSGLLGSIRELGLHGDPDVIYEQSYRQEVCPFEVGLELIGDASVVICDYNYVFDPAIGVDALLGEGALLESVLVVDEGHNLVQRSREYYSPVLEMRNVQKALLTLRERDNRVFRRLRELCALLLDLIESSVGAVLADGRIGEEKTLFSGKPTIPLSSSFSPCCGSRGCSLSAVTSSFISPGGFVTRERVSGSSAVTPRDSVERSLKPAPEASSCPPPCSLLSSIGICSASVRSGNAA